MRQSEALLLGIYRHQTDTYFFVIIDGVGSVETCMSRITWCVRSNSSETRAQIGDDGKITISGPRDQLTRLLVCIDVGTPGEGINVV